MHHFCKTSILHLLQDDGQPTIGTRNLARVWAVWCLRLLRCHRSVSLEMEACDIAHKSQVAQNLWLDAEALDEASKTNDVTALVYLLSRAVTAIVLATAATRTQGAQGAQEGAESLWQGAQEGAESLWQGAQGAQGARGGCAESASQGECVVNTLICRVCTSINGIVWPDDHLLRQDSAIAFVTANGLRVTADLLAYHRFLRRKTKKHKKHALASPCSWLGVTNSLLGMAQQRGWGVLGGNPGPELAAVQMQAAEACVGLSVCCQRCALNLCKVVRRCTNLNELLEYCLPHDERERERERKKQTKRERQANRERHTCHRHERERDRQIERERERHTCHRHVSERTSDIYTHTRDNTGLVDACTYRFACA